MSIYQIHINEFENKLCNKKTRISQTGLTFYI